MFAFTFSIYFCFSIKDNKKCYGYNIHVYLCKHVCIHVYIYMFAYTFSIYFCFSIKAKKKWYGRNCPVINVYTTIVLTD